MLKEFFFPGSPGVAKKRRDAIIIPQLSFYLRALD
jgi:hypothetical protein